MFGTGIEPFVLFLEYINFSGVDTTLVNEVFVKDAIELMGSGGSVEILESRIEEVKAALIETIHQEVSQMFLLRDCESLTLCIKIFLFNFDVFYYEMSPYIFFVIPPV